MTIFRPPGEKQKSDFMRPPKQGPKPAGPRRRGRFPGLPRNPGGPVNPQPTPIPGIPGFPPGDTIPPPGFMQPGPVDTLPEGPFPPTRKSAPRVPNPIPFNPPPDTTMPIGYGGPPGTKPGPGMQWARQPAQPAPYGDSQPFQPMGMPAEPTPKGYGANPGTNNWQPKNFKNPGSKKTFKALSNEAFWANLNPKQKQALFKSAMGASGGAGAYDIWKTNLLDSGASAENMFKLTQNYNLDPGKLMADLQPKFSPGMAGSTYINNAGNTPPTLQPYQQDPEFMQAMLNQMGPQGMSWGLLENLFPGQDFGGPPGNMYQNPGSGSILNQMGNTLSGVLPPGFQFAPWAGQFNNAYQPQIPPGEDVPMNSLMQFLGG